MRGRLKHAENLRADLQRKIRKEQERQIIIVMGTKSAVKSKKKPKTKTMKGQPTLAPYVSKWMKIQRKYKGKIYKAAVRADGTVNYNGKIYNSPSMAGKAVVNRSCDGWLFWHYKNTKGNWVKLDELRKNVPGR